MPPCAAVDGTACRIVSRRGADQLAAFAREAEMAGKPTQGPRSDGKPALAGNSVRVAQPAAAARRTAGKADGASRAGGAPGAAQPYLYPGTPPGGVVGLASLDRMLEAWRAPLTGGASPPALWRAAKRH